MILLNIFSQKDLYLIILSLLWCIILKWYTPLMFICFFYSIKAIHYYNTCIKKKSGLTSKTILYIGFVSYIFLMFFNSYSLTSEVLVIVACIILLLLFRLFRFLKFYIVLIALRISFHLLLVIVLGYYIISLKFVSQMLSFLISNSFFLLPILLCFWTFYQLIRILYYELLGILAYNNLSNHILYLRNFHFDNENNPLAREATNILLENCKKDIVKVADQQTIITFPNTYKYGYESTTIFPLYLVSAEWKKQLRNFIKKSHHVVVYLFPSDGIMWEALNNSEYLDKYTFITPNDGTFLTMLLSYDKQKKLSLTKALLQLSNIFHSDSNKLLIFSIKSNTCYYYTLGKILSNEECSTNIHKYGNYDKFITKTLLWGFFDNNIDLSYKYNILEYGNEGIDCFSV